jgi:DNA-binding beta-propeller fold protein YncE
MNGSGGACATDAQLNQAYGVAVSPDGHQVYVTAHGNSIVEQFEVGAGGTLTRAPGSLGCVRETPVAGDCQDGTGLNGAFAIAIAPDGKTVYVSGYDGNTISILSRNAATGTLTPAGCVSETATAGCTVLAGLINVYAIAVSPDNKSVFTTGNGTTDSGVAVFARDTTTGALSQPFAQPCFNQGGTSGCAGANGLDGGGEQLAVSADSKHVYVPAQGSGGGGLAIFVRAVDGSIVQPADACINAIGSGGCSDGPSDLAGTVGVAADPTGAFVYALTGTGVIGYSRDATTGALTQIPGQGGCITENGSGGACRDGNLVSPASTAAMTATGSLVALHNATSGLAFLSRDPATGTLSQMSGAAGCLEATGASGCQAASGLGTSKGTLQYSPDGNYLYQSSFSPGNIAVLDRDRAPVCQPSSATVSPGSSVAVGLSCSDPNGDPITYSISRSPTNGVVAGVDQGAATVGYSPLAGFSGADSFGYTATARGLTSPEATATISVEAPGGGAPADRTLTIDPSKKTVKKGKKVGLSGELNSPTSHGCEVGQGIEVERSKKGGAFEHLDGVTTDDDGEFSIKAKVTRTTMYRATAEGNSDCGAATSNTAKVNVKRRKHHR